jgi:ornithine decarboxylase
MRAPQDYFAADDWQQILTLADSQQPPFLLLKLDAVLAKYHALQQAFPTTALYYALKANPTLQIIDLLNQLGCGFELASVYELRACLQQGVPAQRLCFGNPIKKQAAIAEFYQAGVRLFVSDCVPDLHKIAQVAPKSAVYVRISIESSTASATADWPLDRKFGCPPDEAASLLVLAAQLGLNPIGVSFHVGSQQNHPKAWRLALSQTKRVFEQTKAAGLTLNFINLGGGLPSRYLRPIPDITDFAREIYGALAEFFPEQALNLMLEPGRYLVAEAGVVVTEVALVTKKSGNHNRWVFTDIGVFGGMTESLGEATKYPIWTRYPADVASEDVVLAGPTCDSRDVLYEKYRYRLPVNLQAGDKLYLLSAGAYTAACGCSGYNGFPPLAVYCL